MLNVPVASWTERGKSDTGVTSNSCCNPHTLHYEVQSTAAVSQEDITVTSLLFVCLLCGTMPADEALRTHFLFTRPVLCSSVTGGNVRVIGCVWGTMCCSGRWEKQTTREWEKESSVSEWEIEDVGTQSPEMCRLFCFWTTCFKCFPCRSFSSEACLVGFYLSLHCCYLWTKASCLYTSGVQVHVILS